MVRTQVDGIRQTVRNGLDPTPCLWQAVPAGSHLGSRIERVYPPWWPVSITSSQGPFLVLDTMFGALG